MAETETDKPNGGVFVELVDDSFANHAAKQAHSRTIQQDATLSGVLYRLMSDIFFADRNTGGAASSSILQRTKKSFHNHGSLLHEACTNAGRNLLIWTRRGSPLRALLVISVGTIALLSLTGLLVFMLFFVTATVNAIVISLLMSLAAVGGFLAFFFACVTAIYVGALSIAVFVISIATVSAVIAVLVATGWIGFFCVVWMAMSKSLGLAKHSLSMTGSALSAYTSARHGPRQEVNKAVEVPQQA